MTSFASNSRVTNILSLREGATVAALAVLAPLAVQGLLVSILWNLAQWGSISETVVEGVTFFAGSTLSIALAIVVVVIIRYAVLVGYWLLVVERFGEPRRRAFLAALPLAGLWWSFKIASRIARREDRPRRLTPEFTVATVGFTVLTMFLLPLSMQVATATETGEVERLAAPCLDEFPASAPEEPVIAVGPQGLSRADFDQLVDEVVQGQRGAVARISEEWPTQVADTQVRMLLWEQAASPQAANVSVGDMEDLIEDWEVEFGGTQGLHEILLDNGIPPSQTKRYACAAALSAAFAEVNPFVETPSGSTEYEEALREVADRLGVVVDPTIGFWNSPALSVTSEPAPQVEPETAAESPEPASEPVARTFSTRVEYDIDSIPTQEFQDSLGWQANICAGATELLQDRFLDRVSLFKRTNERWVAVQDAEVTAQRGGRCAAGQVNLLVSSNEVEPPTNWTDKGWRTCRDYQVRIPETPTFQAATVNMCVSTRADSAADGV